MMESFNQSAACSSFGEPQGLFIRNKGHALKFELTDENGDYISEYLDVYEIRKLRAWLDLVLPPAQGPAIDA